MLFFSVAGGVQVNPRDGDNAATQKSANADSSHCPTGTNDEGASLDAALSEGECRAVHLTISEHQGLDVPPISLASEMDRDDNDNVRSPSILRI